MPKSKNNIRQIRKMLKISSEELASMIGCSVPHVYAIETGVVKLNTDWIIKISNALRCDASQLTDDLTDSDVDNIKKHYYNYNITYNNSIVNSKRSNYTVNNAENLDSLNVKFYKNIIDLSNQQNALNKKIDVQTLQFLTNCHNDFDFSEITLCCDGNDVLFIDASQTTVTERPQLFIIKNELVNNTTTFFATIYIDVITGATIMKMQDGSVRSFVSTCKIIGRVIKKIIDV